MGLFLLLLGSQLKIALYIGAVYFIFIFFFRLRRDMVNEYRNSHNQLFGLKEVNEKSITNLNKIENQRIFFGLGRVLYNQGWDYFTSADLLLLLSLFFIMLQIFLGGELGVSVAGFFFLPIELGKILLTLYFADWVSRIDKGMELNVLWIYGLVLIPFLLLIAFLKDFSPLLVFSFVFFYHIIKIKKSLKFKIFLFILIFTGLIISVSDIGKYSFPFNSSPYNLILVILFLITIIILIVRNWVRSQFSRLGVLKSLVVTIALIFIFFTSYQVLMHRDLPVPKVLGDRISSWLNPWQDYNLSYQYINSIWLIKGTGLFGDANKTLEHAVHVPLIEQDLSFGLYVGVLGLGGIVLLFGTLLVLVVYVHQLVVRYRDGPFRWEVYVLEFLTVIFAAQFIFPALYVVGLLPIMSQPLPFLAYSNNMLLLFSLPFAFLMVVVVNNLEKS
jgi:cell division protein FtsW (lipid II flippase)